MPDSRKPNNGYKAVFISPHLDDAVFSCGGTIAQLSATGAVLVINVFTYYPREFRKRAITAGPERHAEEHSAAQFLGYESLNLEETDAIFRKSIRGSPSRLFRPPSQIDTACLATIRGRIDEILAGLAYETLYVPMGIGWHVDHVLCHLATRHHLGQPSVFMYEDAPYCLVANATRYRVHELGRTAQNPALSPPPSRRGLLRDWLTTSRSYLGTAPVARIRPSPLRFAAHMVISWYIWSLLAQHLSDPGYNGLSLRDLTNDISGDFDRKLAASYLYASQIGEFFMDRRDCLARYTAYSETMGKPGYHYERFWKAESGPDIR